MKRTGLMILMAMLSLTLGAQQTLTLEQCRKLAMEHNQKIKMAGKQVEAADAAKRAAFTQYFPNFSMNGAYTHTNKEYQLLKNDLFLPVVPYTAIDQSTGGLSSAVFTDPAVAASTFVINPATGSVVTDASGNPVFKQYTYVPASETKFGIENLYVINGGFTQPIFLGGKIRETNRMAEYAKQIARHNLTLTQNELIYSADEAYWRIVSLTAKVKVAQEYKAMLERLVSDLDGIRYEGIITSNDLMKAKVKLSEAELLLLKASNGLELSKMVLCQMTGVEYSSTLTLSDSLNYIDPALLSYIIDESTIADRPELKILETNVGVAKSGVSLMLSRYLPNIVMNAGYTYVNPNPYNGFAEEFGNDWSVGVVCNIPLFHFGDKKHTLAAARYEQQAAELKVEETRELLVLQLQQAVYQYTESVKKSECAQMALSQAKQNLDISNDNFEEGMIKTTDVLEAQVMWQKASSELIDATTEQQMAVSNLKKVTGKY